ncbi:MAG TPA: acyltransferase family protein, partial [Acidimicrobiales bacterium]
MAADTTTLGTVADTAAGAGSVADTVVGTGAEAGAVAGNGADAPAARPAPPRRRPSWQGRPLGYHPALDGLRAMAVALVVAYHLGYARVAGGYVGVEVFFVLSGWLVCAVLVNEHHRTGGIALARFWLRRARRLLPAMAVVIAGTAIVTSVARPERLAELRDHAGAAIGYHLNWRLVLDQRSYFEAAGGPSPLEHLWSLSIEEQFYLVFPLLCGLVLTRWSRKVAVAVALGGAAVATALRFALLDPAGDPSRVYFGTDTRAAGLLLGVALGLFWTPNRLRPHDERRFVALLDGVALAGAAVLAWYAVELDERAPAAFRAGFAAAQVATLAVIAVAVYPAPTRTVRLLSARPLRWVGQRSYGVYLFHWPVIVFLSAAPGEQPESPGRVAAQVVLVLALAAASYRLVEQPVRRRGLAGAARAARARVAALVEGRPSAAAAATAGCVVALAAVAGITRDVVTASPPPPFQPEAVVITGADPGAAGGPDDPALAPADPPAPAAPGPGPDDPPPGDGPAPVPAGSPAPAPADPSPAEPAPAEPPAATGYVPTTAVGDSVLVGAAAVLAGRMGPALTVDAEIGRQMADAAGLVAGMAARGALGQVVLLHLGNNGPFTAAQIEAVLAAAGPDRTVLLVNVSVPRRWEAEVNEALAAAAGRHPNAVLVDWRSLVTSEPGLTRDDGFHLTAAGAERYADLI